MKQYLFILLLFSMCTTSFTQSINSVEKSITTPYEYYINEFRGRPENTLSRMNTKNTTMPLSPYAINAKTQKLDSIYNESSKTIYTYDEMGRQVKEIRYKFSASSINWEYAAKREFSYSTSGTLMEERTYLWNTTANDWAEDYKYLYEFDNLGNQTLYEIHRWDLALNTWKGINKFVYQYNSQGLLEFDESYDWSSDLNDWTGFIKWEYQYNNENNVLEITSEWNTFSKEWYERAWDFHYYNDENLLVADSSYSGPDTNLYKVTLYNYNEEENLIDKIRHHNEIGFGFYTAYIDSFFYDIDNQLVLETQHHSSNSEMTIQHTNTTEYSYDEFGNVSSYTSYIWNDDLNKLVQSWKGELGYDANGNKLFYKDYSWNEESMVWLGKNGYENIFDINTPISDLILPYWKNNTNNKLLSRTILEFYIDTETWGEVFTDFYYYSDVQPSALKLNESNHLTIYPNPTKESIQFKSLTGDAYLEISDYSGKVVYQNTIQTEMPLSLEMLNAGIYVYTLRQGNDIYTGKLIKQ